MLVFQLSKLQFLSTEKVGNYQIVKIEERKLFTFQSKHY